MREEGWQAYLDCVRELLTSPQVQAMRQIRHHPGVSCYEHSVFVSYTAFRLAEKWRGDRRAAARAGLLHDLCHMWPMARHIPRCREAAAVCLADKLCATAEVLKIWKGTRLRREALAVRSGGRTD